MQTSSGFSKGKTQSGLRGSKPSVLPNWSNTRSMVPLAQAAARTSSAFFASSLDVKCGKGKHHIELLTQQSPCTNQARNQINS